MFQCAAEPWRVFKASAGESDHRRRDHAISISKTDLQTYICQRLDHDHARYQVASDKEHDIEFVFRTNIMNIKEEM